MSTDSMTIEAAIGRQVRTAAKVNIGSKLSLAQPKRCGATVT
jgi:hypothetical protein